MKYITIVAPSYEDAVREAREKYGEKLRIHSRRDIVSKGFLGLGRNTRCELTCFISDEKDIPRPSAKAAFSPAKENKAAQKPSVDEKDMQVFEEEAKTPNPDRPEEKEIVPASSDAELKEEEVSSGAVQPEDKPSDKEENPVEPVSEGEEEDLLAPLMDHAKRILLANDFSEAYIRCILEDLRSQLEPALPAIPNPDEFELLIVDRIVGSVEIDHNSQLHPPKIFTVVGPTGVGKTTTIAKIAAIYGTLPPEEIRKKVKIITLDSFRIGAYEQMENFGKALGIEVYRADDEAMFYEALDNCRDAELILIDTIGKSPVDNELNVKLQTLLSVPERSQMRSYLAVSASMKKCDIDKVFDQFKMFNIHSVIVTKTDETQTIGNIISICHDRHLPLLFITDGQKVPRDIHMASSAFMLGLLQGFNMDFNSLWNTQIGATD